MYGNVDAAIKFFKTLIDVTAEDKGMKMQQSQVDPCLLYLHEDGELKLIVTITVDDCAVSGHPTDVKWFMDGLESRFNVIRGGTLRKHLTSGVLMRKEESILSRRLCIRKEVLQLIN